MELIALITRLLDPAVQSLISDLTVIAILTMLVIIGPVALIKKWVVIGWTYRDKEKEVKKLENRLNMMEVLAWRGTHMAEQGTNVAERFAHENGDHNGSHK